MKKLLPLLTLGLTLISVSGQGLVDFRNGGPTFQTVADRCVYLDVVGGQKLVGTEYVAGLWYAPGSDLSAVDASISADRGSRTGPDFHFRAATTSEGNKGTWTIPIGTSSHLTLDGVPQGSVAALQVRVWNSAKFGSFAEAFAGGEYSISAPFSYTPPFSDLPYAYYMENLRAFPTFPTGGISVNDIVVAEGSNGVVQAEFTVKVLGQPTSPVSVDYQTEDGSAIAGQDYVATSGTLTFASGETSKRVSVTLTADGPAEPDETFRLRLSNPVNVVLGKTLGSCTITEVRIAGLRVDTVVSFNTVPNRRYTVERSSNTIDWEPVPDASSVPGTGGIVTIVDPGSGCQPMRAYRARLVE
jgi:hypothetical protein